MVARVRSTTAEERFWSNVDKCGECWTWTGYIKPNGYASFYPGGGRHVGKVYAHRFSYELVNGPIPNGMEIDHTCNVRNCVNPAHLEVVTHRENLDRAKDRRTHCPHGHEFTDENSYWWNGYRSCRTCRTARHRRMSLIRGV